MHESPVAKALQIIGGIAITAGIVMCAYALISYDDALNAPRYGLSPPPPPVLNLTLIATGLGSALQGLILIGFGAVISDLRAIRAHTAPRMLSPPPEPSADNGSYVSRIDPATRTVVRTPAGRMADIPAPRTR